MIEGICACGSAIAAPESAVNQPLPCGSCGKSALPVCAEPLAEGAGAGDFDGQLIVAKGPALGGQQYLLGGVVDIEIGKLPGKHIMLPGAQVSRNHATLSRVDFGPSRWKVTDTKSTNGVFVNGAKIAERELENGDLLRIGDFELKYQIAALAEADGDAVVLDESLEEVEPMDDGGGGGAAVATPVAAPAKPMITRSGVLVTRKLSYAAPTTPDQRLLGDCDINWVMKLRNASRLMVMVININFWGRFFVPDEFVGYVKMLTSLMSFAAAFLLTAPEPDAPESSKWFSSRLFLRIFAGISCLGELMLMIGTQMLVHSVSSDDDFTPGSHSGSTTLMVIGGILWLANIPQLGLFLWYLRKLAIRIPAPGLALNALLVMVGLPLAFMMTVGGPILAGIIHAPGLLILSGLGGLLALAIFYIWYLILLIWFSKSFS